MYRTYVYKWSETWGNLVIQTLHLAITERGVTL